VDRSSLTGEVTVELAKLKADLLAVEVNMDDTLQQGWEVAERTVEPRIVKASGPVEVMQSFPRLKTERLVLMNLLERQGFDPESRTAQEFEQSVQVLPPANSKITIDEARTVRVRIKIHPSPMQRDDVDIAPSLLFPGPTFVGFPYKLTLLPTEPPKVRLRVRGHELMLLNPQIDATKAQFAVFAKVPEGLLADLGRLAAGGSLPPFEVEVRAPLGITVLDYQPKRLSYSLDPIDTKVEEK
jgi:hypothetical protein